MGSKYPVLSAKAVRDRRHLAAMTQEQLAKKAGLHVTTIRSIEAEEDTKKAEGTRTDTVRKLADALECQPVDLFITGIPIVAEVAQ